MNLNKYMSLLPYESFQRCQSYNLAHLLTREHNRKSMHIFPNHQIAVVDTTFVLSHVTWNTPIP